MEVLKIKPSRIVGEIKDEIKEAIMDGIISNSYDEAYSLLLKIAEKKGLDVNWKPDILRKCAKLKIIF